MRRVWFDEQYVLELEIGMYGSCIHCGGSRGVCWTLMAFKLLAHQGELFEQVPEKWLRDWSLLAWTRIVVRIPVR